MNSASDSQPIRPNFLVVGAMKSGTTTLYRDLLTNPSVFFPIDKEPGNLVNGHVLTPEGRRQYTALFARAGSDQLCGDASTDYTKLPDIPGVPARARKLLGPDLRIIYLVREPVARAISHHRHLLTGGDIDELDFNLAIESCPQLVNFGLYAMQIEPWINEFGSEQVYIARFEGYIGDRQTTVESICRFLGVEPASHRVATGRVFNESEGKPVVRGLFRHLQSNTIYQNAIRPLLPVGLKDRLRTALLPKATETPVAPTPKTVECLLARFESDSRRLAEIMNRNTALWNTDEVRQRAIDPRKPGASTNS